MAVLFQRGLSIRLVRLSRRRASSLRWSVLLLNGSSLRFSRLSRILKNVPSYPSLVFCGKKTLTRVDLGPL